MTLKKTNAGRKGLRIPGAKAQHGELRAVGLRAPLTARNRRRLAARAQPVVDRAVRRQAAGSTLFAPFTDEIDELLK